LPRRREDTKVHKVGSWFAWLQVVNRENHENREQNSRFRGDKGIKESKAFAVKMIGFSLRPLCDSASLRDPVFFAFLKLGKFSLDKSDQFDYIEPSRLFQISTAG
jgi:hypothetical protein